jgi:hypothetical protein
VRQASIFRRGRGIAFDRCSACCAPPPPAPNPPICLTRGVRLCSGGADVPARGVEGGVDRLPGIGARAKPPASPRFNRRVSSWGVGRDPSPFRVGPSSRRRRRRRWSLTCGYAHRGCRCLQGAKTNCVDQKNLLVYLADPKDPKKVYSYDLNGLQKNPSGWKSSGQGASYFYYLNVGKAMKTLPEPSCSGAQGECSASGCSGYQTSSDGGACYAVGDTDSLSATFYDPNANAAGDPGDGVTIIMSSGGGCMDDKRWAVIRLICGSSSAPGRSIEVPSMTCVYEVFWTHPAGCPIALSIGYIILICLSGFCVLYFGGGYFLNARQGQPGIPNEDFWFSLPDLVKDGYYFATEKTAGLSGKSGYEGL